MCGVAREGVVPTGPPQTWAGGCIGLLIHTQRDQVKKAVFLETDSTAVATAV